MNVLINLVAVLALLVASFGQPTTVSAGDVRKTEWQGVEAFFSNTDPSGCIVTQVGVFARDDMRHEPPEPGTTESLLALSIYQVNDCTGEQLLFAEGYTWLDEGDLQISKKLQSATLNATVNLEDLGATPNFDVDVDLTWTANEPAARSSSHSHLDQRGCKIISHWRGMSRFADVSGTVSVGTTNFTPETGSGSIFAGRGSDLFIGCE